MVEWIYYQVAVKSAMVTFQRVQSSQSQCCRRIMESDKKYISTKPTHAVLSTGLELAKTVLISMIYQPEVSMDLPFIHN